MQRAQRRAGGDGGRERGGALLRDHMVTLADALRASRGRAVASCAHQAHSQADEDVFDRYMARTRPGANSEKRFRKKQELFFLKVYQIRRLKSLISKQ